MKKFSMDAKVRLLPRCYDETGKWTATTNDIIKWFDELGIAWRPKAKRGNPLSAYAMEVLRNYPNIADIKKIEHRNDERRSNTKSYSGRSLHDTDEEQIKGRLLMEVTPLKKRSREQQHSLITDVSSIVCNDKTKLIKLRGRDPDFNGCIMSSECPTVTPVKKRNRNDLDMEEQN
jgi:hypothetical protein